MCEAGSHLELTLEPFYDSLKDTLLRHRQKSVPFSESFLWYVMLVLNKYALFQEGKGYPATTTFDNVLIWQDGRVKVIPYQLIPHQNHNTLTIPSENEEKRPILSTEAVIGYMVLTLADLLDPTLMQPEPDSWQTLDSNTLAETLQKC